MKSGIYKIYNETKDLIYIGRSINIQSRISNHKSQLRAGTHNCKALQADWDNGDSIVFKTIEHCEEKLLPERENYWICKFSPRYLYNKNTVATIESKDREKTIELIKELTAGKENTNIFIINL